MYQEVVTITTARAEGTERAQHTLQMFSRFVPFVWMYVWSVLLTGIALMLFSPKFLFLRFEDVWSVLLTLKQLIFLVMVFFSVGYARMNSRLVKVVHVGDAGHQEEAQQCYAQIRFFGRVNIALGIVALAVAVGMR